MKKWAYVVALALLVAAATAGWWVPWITGFAVQKKETIEPLKNLVELVGGAGGGLLALIKFLLDRSEEKSKAQQAGSRGTPILHSSRLTTPCTPYPPA